MEVFVDEREDELEPFCSACGTHNEGDIDTCMSYCPHCGAKMEGDARKEYWHAYLATICADALLRKMRKEARDEKPKG